jgi:hypothetical protein
MADSFDAHLRTLMKHEVEITTCRPLLKKAPEEHVRTISVWAVNFEEYEQLGPIGSQIVRAFCKRATDKADCAPEESFEPFIFGWIALNSWASCVTGTESDEEYRTALVLDRELNARFGSMCEQPDFKANLEQFRSYWPILRPMPRRRIQDQATTRQERILHALTHPGKDSKFRPECASRHFERGEQIPADWPHTLSAIYQVRCNLFHGSKSLDSDIDTEIVFNAFRVLARILPMLDV